MSVISVATVVTGQTITASLWNTAFSTITSDYNGGITNANISASAGIDITKVSTGVTGSLVGTTDIQTLTNKTLTSPTITTPTVTNGTFTKPTISGSIQTLTTDVDGATVTFNLAASNVHTVTLGGSRVLALSNASVGQSFVISLIQGSGGQTVTWFSTIKWPNGATPTLSTGAGKIDVFGFICASSGNFYGFIVGQNL